VNIPRKFFSATAVAGASLVATAAFAAPVKIAVLESLSGPQASTGLLYRDATKYSVDRINAAGGWNGEPIQLVEYDNQGGTNGAADKVKAAIADGVQFIVQGASSAISGQITEDVRKHNLRNPGREVVFLNVGGEALELTGEKCHFHHFRFNGNAQIRIKTLVNAMKEANALGKRVYSINQNYSWGTDVEKAIVDNAAAGGYQVVEKTLHDVNKVQDFGPYVAKISAANVDTVITGNWSNDLLLLMKASKSAGLKVRFGTTFLDQPGNLANAGEAAVGHYIVHLFNPEAGGAKGDAFANDYKAKTGHFPAFIEGQTVNGVSMWGEALKSVKPVNGKLNVNAVAKALETTKLTTPMGEMRMRAEDHQVMLPVVVSVVDKSAKYKVDGTDMGFKPVKVFTADESATPVQASCKMQRAG
jgi:branched-chain amino acid transport system substrate-binding protein